MRKLLFALTTISVIFLLIAPVVQEVIVKALFSDFYIYILSPRPSNERIYQRSPLPLTIGIGVRIDSPEITSIYYRLDGNDDIALLFSRNSDISYSASGTLSTLAEGNHTLEISAFDVNGGVVISEQETFAVVRNFSYPTVTIISPLNQTYSVNEVPLTYSIDGNVLRAHHYLDNSPRETFSGNITLTELSEGQHKIEVNVHSQAFNYPIDKYEEQIVYFTVDTSKNDTALTLNNPTSIVVIAIIAIAIVAVALVIFYNRNKLKVSN